MDKEIAMYLIILTLNIINLFKTHKNKKKNKFIVSER